MKGRGRVVSCNTNNRVHPHRMGILGEGGGMDTRRDRGTNSKKQVRAVQQSINLTLYTVNVLYNAQCTHAYSY